MSPLRRDGEGRPEIGPTWESLVDKQIREAMADGVFDALPYQGQRLPLEDDAAAGEWALAYRMLRNAGAAPPWIEADKEVRALLSRLEGVLAQASGSAVSGRARDRAEVRRLVAAANRAIERLNVEAPTDGQRRPLLDEAVEVARLEGAREVRG
jgi:hypothetical protein